MSVLHIKVHITTVEITSMNIYCVNMNYIGSDLDIFSVLIYPNFAF